MAYPCYEGVEQSCLSISQLQQKLAGGGLCDPTIAPALHEALDDLNSRLMRVRSLGGDYSLIDFSPDVKVLMTQVERMDVVASIQE
jgi:hypothetical protein